MHECEEVVTNIFECLLVARVKHRNIKQAVCSRCEVRNRMIDAAETRGRKSTAIYAPALSFHLLMDVRGAVLYAPSLSSCAELCSTRGSCVICGAVLYAWFERHMWSRALRMLRACLCVMRGFVRRTRSCALHVVCAWSCSLHVVRAWSCALHMVRASCAVCVFVCSFCAPRGTAMRACTA